MDNEKLLISRILADNVPAYDYDIEQAYKESLDDAIFSGCLTNQELLDKLGTPIDFVSEISKNHTILIKKKQKLYEWVDTPSSKDYREEIKSIRSAISFLLTQQYKFFNYSAESIAEENKRKAICKKYKIKKIPEKLSEEDIRRVARSNEWHAMQTAGFSFTVFSDNVIELLNWAKRYDNIRQHPECPDEHILKDDDLLDGWTSYILNKKLDDNPADGKEVFIPAHNPQDIKRIQGKNSPEARFMIKMREKKMMEGELQEKDLPDKRGLIKF
jgi:hypothetical protein